MSALKFQMMLGARDAIQTPRMILLSGLGLDMIAYLWRVRKHNMKLSLNGVTGGIFAVNREVYIRILPG